MKTNIRSTKHQTPNPNKTLNLKHRLAFEGARAFGIWKFVGVWCLVLGVCVGPLTLDAATFLNPVLAGDFPDPSVIRVGDDYWATATTSEWAPLFPLLHSRDLVHGEHVGNVFERRPEWAVGNFWAPELFEHKGKFYVYYV